MSRQCVSNTIIPSAWIVSIKLKSKAFKMHTNGLIPVAHLEKTEHLVSFDVGNFLYEIDSRPSQANQSLQIIFLSFPSGNCYELTIVTAILMKTPK